MTAPVSVFQCSLWTSPNSSKDTNTSRLWRSFSFQMLKVFPCRVEVLGQKHSSCVSKGHYKWKNLSAGLNKE